MLEKYMRSNAHGFGLNNVFITIVLNTDIKHSLQSKTSKVPM